MAGSMSYTCGLLAASFLAFFLGLRLMQNLSLAGPLRLELLLLQATSTPLRGMVTGTVVTALAHSSSAVTIATIALVTSGCLPLANALGIVLGSNIGTCATVQFLAFDLTWFGFPLALAGTVAALVCRRRWRRLALAASGLGFILLALTLLSRALTPLATETFFRRLLASWTGTPTAAFAAGLAGTAVIQSSTLFVAGIMSFSSQGLIDLPTAVALVLGSNIGTCADTLAAAIWSNGDGRRLALAHLLLNTAGALVFLPFTDVFAFLIHLTSPSLAGQVANTHLCFNLVTSLVALPFTPAFARRLDRRSSHKYRR